MDIKEHYKNLSERGSLPANHALFLHKLKTELGFEPQVIYDIGSCVLHWTKEAKRVWPSAQIYLFDAFEHYEFLYKDYPYNIGVLSDTDDKQVKFYQNFEMPTGNSYYREIGSNMSARLFPENGYALKKTATLDTVRKNRSFPLPDLIKMDVQGAELDVVKGGLDTLKNCKYLILEMQSVDYNLGAPKSNEIIRYMHEIGFVCKYPKFCDYGPDADYCFVNTHTS